MNIDSTILSKLQSAQKILICGDRNWTDYNSVKTVCLYMNSSTTIIHGACRGADLIADEVAKEMGLNVIPFPANWTLYGKAAGPIRNQQMLDEDPELIIACHDNLFGSKGTKDMVNRGKAKKVDVFLLLSTPFNLLKL